MKTFKDNQGRDWEIKINVNSVQRVRDLLEVDLLKVSDGKLIEKLYRDPILLCNVIYAVCKPQADKLDITDEQFGEAMAGDAIEDATKALLEDLTDFFPNQRDRSNLQKVIQATWNVMDKIRDQIDVNLDQTIQTVTDQAIAEATKELTPPITPTNPTNLTVGSISGSLPELSG